MPEQLHTRETLRARRKLSRKRSVYVRRRAIAGAVLLLLLAGVSLGFAHGGGHTRQLPDSLLLASPTVFPHRTPAPAPAPPNLPYVAIAGPQGREVALTFDDGPGPYTPSIVHALRRAHAPATFFQVGFTEHYFTQGLRDELADPNLFVIGDHSWNHPRLDKLSATDQAEQIDQQSLLLTTSGAPAPRYFRPPYGAFDETTLKLLEQRQMQMIMWSVDSEDYRRPGVPAIVANVMNEVKPGAIILMHDAGGDRTQTLAAIPLVVAALRAKHYTLVTIPQLLHDAPPPAKQPPIAIGAG